MASGDAFPLTLNDVRQSILALTLICSIHARIKEKGESERIIFVNRISPEKGLHLLLEAF
jgi:glycosyltransferase involved in cell wall biosynthesis